MSRASDRKLHDPLMQDDDEPRDTGGGGVPRREQLLHVSWMFLFASLVRFVVHSWWVLPVFRVLDGEQMSRSAVHAA